MKRFVIYAVVAAIAFMLSASAHAMTILSEQNGTENEGNKADNTFSWSHALKFSGDHESEPFKFYYSFGSSQNNQDGYQFRNGLLNAFEWSHSLALSGDRQETPFNFNYQYGQLIDVEGSYMSMNGPEHNKRPAATRPRLGGQGDAPDTTQHCYHYESYGLGIEPDTGYVPPEGPYVAPEPVSILLMGLGSLWIITRP